MSTYDNDHLLPSLPVPDLSETRELAQALIAPLVDAQTLAATKAAFEAFCAPGGAGQKLQQALERHKAVMPGNASWLRPLWDDMYLSWRGHLPLEMNYFFRFREERWGGDSALARLALALAGVCRSLGRQELPPEPVRKGFAAMDQARSCLYTRIPGAGVDTLVPVALCAPPKVAVCCKGHWFCVRLTAEDESFVSVKALQDALAEIRAQGESLDKALPVGAMTAALREDAAALRAKLAGTLRNRLSLRELENCLFAICLDGPAQDEHSFAGSLLCGDSANRWFDKSLQLIASENGFLGANFEHAGCDAAIWVYLLGLADEKASREPERAGTGAAAQISTLPFEGTEETTRILEAMQADCARRLQEVRYVCRDVPGLSRPRIKSCKTSPDAFTQIAFQAAQFAAFGKLRSSYEAVAVRSFAGGRTECARASTAGALAVAELLNKGGSDATLLRLYREAEAAHVTGLRRCQQGLGAERHMSGLEAMFRLHGKALGLGSDVPPAVFTDPGWRTLKHDALSTSGIGAPCIRFFGFGPVVEDGFGIGYAPGDEGTGMVVTALAASGLSPASLLAEVERAAACVEALLREEEKAGL
ncbi:choline/carnitine O-acyltransferase [Desulfovibrio sp. OttesenSCG-928-G15]|nr:choline/carnitine O-acyltransferase [Desulfovibrio sp. OttesenSCG-928-G15]